LEVEELGQVLLALKEVRIKFSIFNNNISRWWRRW
jgi:hypothetical protein